MTSPRAFLYAPCTLADIPSLIRINNSAFSANPTISTMWPHPQVTQEALETNLRNRFTNLLTNRREIHFFKLTDPATGNMVAWSRWVFPHVLSPEEKKARAEEEAAKARSPGKGHPEGANVEACDEFFGAIYGMQEKYVDSANMYIVQLLATDPAYQRRGLGRRLLEEQLAHVDAEGKVAYIEASAAGLPLYVKLGWKVVDVCDLDWSRWGMESNPWHVLLREPQGKTIA